MTGIAELGAAYISWWGSLLSMLPAPVLSLPVFALPWLIGTGFVFAAVERGAGWAGVDLLDHDRYQLATALIAFGPILVVVVGSGTLVGAFILPLALPFILAGYAVAYFAILFGPIRMPELWGRYRELNAKDRAMFLVLLPMIIYIGWSLGRQVNKSLAGLEATE